MKKNQEIQNIKTTKIYTVIITNCSDCHIKLKQSFAKWNNNFFCSQYFITNAIIFNLYDTINFLDYFIYTAQSI